MVIDPPACSKANQKKIVKNENTPIAIRRSRTMCAGVSSSGSLASTIGASLLGAPPMSPKMPWPNQNCSAPRIMKIAARPKP